VLIGKTITSAELVHDDDCDSHVTQQLASLLTGSTQRHGRK
jgi:hypothetical protein